MQINKIFKTYLPYLLFPLSILYKIVVVFRNTLYDWRLIKINELPCLVISIGNITTGGTGKTPTVLNLCSILTKKNYKVSILSRGYKRNTKNTLLVSQGQGPMCNWEESGDEPYMLSKMTKNIPIVVDENRYRGGLYILKHFKSDVIILDDGFQHRALKRDLDILLIDGSNPLSYRNIIPVGKLREPWKQIERSNLIIFTKKKPPIHLLKKVKKTNIPIFQSITTPEISNHSPNKSELDLKNKNVFLVSGIGNPVFFRETVKDMGGVIKGEKVFPDHYKYKQRDLLSLEKIAASFNTDFIVTTEKDWVKLDSLNATFRFIVINIKILIEDNENEFSKLIDIKFGQHPMQKPHQRT